MIEVKDGGIAPDFTIRNADIQDAAVLAQIHALSWQAAYPGIVPDEVLYEFTPDNRRPIFEKALIEGIGEYTLIFDGDTAAGFLSLGKCWDTDAGETCGEIWSIYLRPDCRGRGIGARLMHWGLEELKKRGYLEATLWVLEENLTARAFYENLGFTLDGAVKDIRIGKILKECRYRIRL